MLCPIRLHSGPLTKSKAVKGGRGLALPTQHFAFPPYSFLLSPCLSHLGPHIVSACLPKLHYMKSFNKDYLSFSLGSAIKQLGDPGQVLATIRFSFISKVKSKTLSVHNTGFPGHSKDIIFQRSTHHCFSGSTSIYQAFICSGHYSKMKGTSSKNHGHEKS